MTTSTRCYSWERYSSVIHNFPYDLMANIYRWPIRNTERNCTKRNSFIIYTIFKDITGKMTNLSWFCYQKQAILCFFFLMEEFCVFIQGKYASINNIRTWTLFGIKLKPFALCMLISFFTTQFPYDAIWSLLECPLCFCLNNLAW